MDRTVRTSIIIVALALAGCSAEPPKPAPDITVERVSAPIENVKLSSLKGKVVLLDFWATWCGPCKSTMPAIDAMYKQYKDQGFEVMGITAEDRPDVVKFVKDNAYNYPLYLDPSFHANVTYKVEGIPRTIVIDRQGNIVYDETGAGAEADLEAAIKSAL